MSREIGQAILHLQPAERVGRTEFVDHWEVMRYLTGKDPRVDPGCNKAFVDALEFDFLWDMHDGPEPWETRGRTTNMGHAVYVEDGSDFTQMESSPFTSVDQVLEFNAVKEYGLTDFSKLVNFYEQYFQNSQRTYDQQVIPGGYYRTIVSGAIAAFGWEMLLEALAEDQQRFGEDVLGSIFEQTMHHVRAWAQTSIEYYICHDDMVWTIGPFINPDFYRSYIFPRYQELWRVLKDAGKRILFCSDGTFDMFIDDLVAAGADGFIFEPSNDLQRFVDKVGKTHVLMGGPDCRTMSFGTKEDIERELQWVFQTAKDCPGYICCTANHLPANIPLDNLLFYFDRVKELGER